MFTFINRECATLAKENESNKLDLMEKIQELAEKEEKLNTIMQEKKQADNQIKQMKENLEIAKKLQEEKEAECTKMEEKISNFENNIEPQLRSTENKLTEKEKLLSLTQTKFNESETIKNKFIEENKALQGKLDTELKNNETMRKEISLQNNNNAELHKELNELMGIYTTLQEQFNEKENAYSNAQLIVTQVQRNEQELNSAYLENIHKVLNSNKEVFGTEIREFNFSSVDSDPTHFPENIVKWFDSLHSFFKLLNPVLVVITKIYI